MNGTNSGIYQERKDYIDDLKRLQTNWAQFCREQSTSQKLINIGMHELFSELAEYFEDNVSKLQSEFPEDYDYNNKLDSKYLCAGEIPLIKIGQQGSTGYSIAVANGVVNIISNFLQSRYFFNILEQGGFPSLNKIVLFKVDTFGRIKDCLSYYHTVGRKTGIRIVDEATSRNGNIASDGSLDQIIEQLPALYESMTGSNNFFSIYVINNRTNILIKRLNYLKHGLEVLCINELSNIGSTIFSTYCNHSKTYYGAKTFRQIADEIYEIIASKCNIPSSDSEELKHALFTLLQTQDKISQDSPQVTRVVNLINNIVKNSTKKVDSAQPRVPQTLEDRVGKLGRELDLVFPELASKIKSLDFNDLRVRAPQNNRPYENEVTETLSDLFFKHYLEGQLSPIIDGISDTNSKQVAVGEYNRISGVIGVFITSLRITSPDIVIAHDEFVDFMVKLREVKTRIAAMNPMYDDTELPKISIETVMSKLGNMIVSGTPFIELGERLKNFKIADLEQITIDNEEEVTVENIRKVAKSFGLTIPSDYNDTKDIKAVCYICEIFYSDCIKILNGMISKVPNTTMYYHSLTSEFNNLIIFIDDAIADLVYRVSLGQFDNHYLDNIVERLKSQYQKIEDAIEATNSKDNVTLESNIKN